MSTDVNARKLLTLCILRRGGKVLLGYKKRGFGAGRWNGFGGKVEPGETVAVAARREFREETGAEPSGLDRRGVLTFTFEGDPCALEVHVFAVASCDGEPEESEEMRPEWFDESAVPFDLMWPDDRYWFPLFLRGASFEGEFHFIDHDTIASADLRETYRAPSA